MADSVYRGSFNPQKALPAFASNAEALAGGLKLGDFYEGPAGVVMQVTTSPASLFSPLGALPEFADNAAALAGDLVAGDLFVHATTKAITVVQAAA